MRRNQLIAETRRLIAEGERLHNEPSIVALRTWLQVSDALLSSAWGSMDRYHMTWLMVGKPAEVVRGRVMTAQEEAAYVREVADGKTAALRMSLDAVERQGMPFLGEDGGIAPGQGMGEVPGGAGGTDGGAVGEAADAQPGRRGRFGEAGTAAEDDLAERLADARRRAEEHRAHEPGVRRAPRPERLQR